MPAESAQIKIRTLPRPVCLLCGSPGTTLYENLADRYFGTPGLWRSVQCQKSSCGLIWLDPSPLESDLHLAYQSYFTHGGADGKLSFAARVRALLFQAYHVLQYPFAAIWGLARAKELRLQMNLNDLPPGRLLDVGCGDGMYLNGMRKRGWTVDGIDFDEKAVASAKAKYGLALHHGSLADAKFPADTFDAVTMSHVIEHVPDPVALLQEIRRILKPGGRMVLTTPNPKSFGHRTYREFWFGVDAPRHLNLYSLACLGDCARKAGLEVVQGLTTAANADIFIGGSLAIRDSPGHRTSGHPRPNPPRVLKAIVLQYREHASLRHEPEAGEEAVLVCKKPS